MVSCIFMLFLHLLHLGLSLFLTSLAPFAPWHPTWHASAATCWLLALIITSRSARNHIAVDLRPLTLSALLLHLLAVWTFFNLYESPSSTDGGGGGGGGGDDQGGGGGFYPAAYYRGYTWTILLQAILCIALVAVDTKRAMAGAFSASPTDYQALPADSAAAAAIAVAEGGAEEESRTWISLFWDTCAYVWPEDFWLQVREGKARRDLISPDPLLLTESHLASIL